MTWRLAAVVFGLALPATVAAQYGAAPTVATRLLEIDAELGRVITQLEDDQQRHVRAEAEVATLAEQRELAQTQLQVRTRALYRLTRAGMLPLAGGFPALLGHVARVERLERLVQADVSAAEEIDLRRAALEMERDRLAVAVEQGERRIRELRSEQAALRAEQHSLMLFDDVFTQSSSDVSPDGYGVSSPGWPAQSIAELRGRLVMPVAGAMRIMDSEDHTSLSFRVDAGTSVRAAAAGRVAYVQADSTARTMIVLDHGEGYFTIYRGLAGSGVAVGEWVREATRLGEVAYGDNGLSFEVRSGTRPLSAREWLGL